MKLYKLLLTFLFASCCWLTISAQCSMQASYTTTHNGNVYTLNASQTGGRQPIQYAWEIDYGMTGLTPNTSYVVTLPTGAHRVCVIAVDTFNCFDSTCSTLYSNCTLAASMGVQNYGPYAVLTPTVSGAHGRLTYRWSGSSSTSTSLTVQTAGQYCVTVTDSVGCVATACYSWAPNTNCNISASVSRYSGTYLVADASNTHGNLSYHWSTGATTYYITPTVSGTYCVTVSDTTGCTDTACIAFAPCNISASLSHTRTPNNAYTYTVTTNGAAPHHYGWYKNNVFIPGVTNSSSVTQTLTPGFYTICVTDTDNNGCRGTACDTFTVPPICTLGTNITIQSFGSSAIVTANVTGAQGGRSFHWSTGASTASITVQNGAIYCVTVTDSTGCSATACAPWAQAGNCYVNASITVNGTYLLTSATGLHGPGTYRWSTGATTPGLVVSTSGTYCVTVSDSVGCADTACVVYTPCNINVALTHTRTPNNVYTYTVTTNGAAPHHYGWYKNNVFIPSGTNSSSITQTLTPGFYTICVTDTDNNGCRGTACDTFTVPPISGNCTLNATVTNQYPPANYANLLTNVTGARGRLTYLWSNGSTASSLFTTTAGNYCVTVTDSVGCRDTACFAWMPCLVAHMSYTHTAANVYTFTGTASGNASAPFYYRWDINNNSYTTVGLSYTTTLAPGHYDVCFVDSSAAGCLGYDCDSFTVYPPAVCGGLAVSIHDSIANGRPMIVANVQGSHVQQSTFLWSTGVATATLANPTIGATYCVTVTDPVNGCTVSDCDTICSFSAAIRDSISGSQNNYTFSPSGVAPYWIWWNGSSGSSYTFQTSGTAAIPFIAKDARGCYYIDTLHPHPCTISTLVSSSHDQYNHYTYAATTVGGQAPYIYYWTVNGAAKSSHTSVMTDSLRAGINVVCETVIDANSCRAYKCDTVNVASPCYLTATLSMTSNTSSVGILRATVANARGSVTYQWSGGASSSNVLTIVNSGRYCVTVTDSTGCSVVLCDSFRVGCSLSARITDSNAVSYHILRAVTTGGTGPYTYAWSPSGTAQTIYAQQSGVYCLTVSDHNACYAYSCDTVMVGCTLHTSVSNTRNINTFTFLASLSGGTAPYTYQWYVDNQLVSAATTATYATTLVNGTHTICSKVRDATGCKDSTCQTLAVTNTTCVLPNTLTDSVVNPGCAYNGGSVKIFVTGGTGVYQYRNGATGTWQTGNQFTGLAAGTYTFYVQDANGCIKSIVATLTRSTTSGYPTVTPTSNSPVAVGSTISLVANATGAVTYSWTGPNGFSSTTTNPTIPNATVAAGGTYQVTVRTTGTSSCSANGQVIVVMTGCSLGGNITRQSTSTYAILTANATGGRAPYTYLWANGSPNRALTVTANGTYCCTIRDSLGCTKTVCDTVTGIGCNLHATFSHSHNTANLYSFAGTPSGGTSPYTYKWYIDNQWVGTATNSTFPYNMITGTHNVCLVIRDLSGCSDSTCQTVIVPQSSCTLAAQVSHVINTSSAVLTAHISGAHGAVSYDWNGISGPVRTVTQSGTYCVNISDSTGCHVTVCDTVRIACSLHASFSTSHGISNVYVFTGMQTGGTAPVTYKWYIDGTLRSSGANSSYYQALSSGVHSVCLTIRDSTGCTDSICQAAIVTSGCTLTGYVTDSITHAFFTTHKYTAIVSGGTLPYTYRWSAGSTSRSYSTILPTTAPTVTVTDANGCSAVLTMQSNNPCRIAVVTSLQNSATYAVLAATVSGARGTVTYHWSNSTSTSSVLTVTASGTYCVTATDSLGCTASSCQYVTLANNRDTICGTVFTDNNGNGVQDGTDQPLANQRIYLYQGTTLIGSYYTNALGQYKIPVMLGIYKLVYTAPSGDAITIPLGSSTSSSTGIYPSVSVTQGNHNYCGYNFGVRSTNVTVSGYVYFDANGNGIQDGGETGVSGQAVHVGPHVVYTNTTGYYVYVGVPDIYAITYIPGASYSAYSVTPSSYSVNASVAGTVYAGNSFGLHNSTSACNIATTIIPVTTITAGFSAWYNVYVSNYGTNVASGTMTFYYDPTLIYSYSNPAHSSVNTTSRFVTFNYSGVLPGQYEMFTVHFTAATTVVPGMSTFEMATATDNCNESNYYDNTDTLHQTTTGSWDPNVKVVTPAGEGAQGLIPRDQELRYTLNFQNTGTSEAVNIVLTDSLSPLLDLSTLHIIGASHPDYAVSMEGHMLVCRFSQIMLPDSNTDEKASHGYLSFSIHPVAGLSDGTRIENNASIYFDYNEAVVTNTTLNTIDYVLSIAELSSHATITVMPNPFSDYTTIRVIGADMSEATLDVYNTLGQIVSTSTPASEGTFTLSRGSMGSGIYSYQIRQSGRAIGSGKLVIE